MNVILINESEGKAWIRTRRVLSRYLPQIGSRTWAGQITQSGLEGLRLKLKEASSKTAAVACHRIVTRSRTELAWIFGSAHCFSDDGRFAFRQTQAKIERPITARKTATQAYAVALVRLAGLFHDLGKGSRAFQAKLQRGSGAEVLRHDLLSFLILAESLWKQDADDKTLVDDHYWLSRLVAHPAAAASCVKGNILLPANGKWIGRICARIKESKGILISRPELQSIDQRAPGLLTVLWLVLTHHRLPNGDDLAEQLDAGRHLNIPVEDAAFQPAPLVECLIAHDAPQPWEDQGWCDDVVTAAKAALAALAEIKANNIQPVCPIEAPSDPAPAGQVIADPAFKEPPKTPLPPFFWPQLSAHLLRPALVLSDHIGSMQATKNATIKRAFKSNTVFANLFDKKHAGDTLSMHLRRVSKLCRQVTSMAMTPSNMPTTTLPHDSAALTEGLPARFAWQSALGDACALARAEGPVFASIIADTGSGKTIGGIRAMHNLSKKGAMRFTLALGLRSLTWQSANSMLDDARIDKKDLRIAVGQPETLGLDAQTLENQAKSSISAAGELNKESNKESNGERRIGSESSSGFELDALLDGTECDTDWLRGLCDEKQSQAYWGKPALAFLSAPVVACTVDHLVSATTMLRGGDAKLFLRQTSSDLLLDEIDVYSASDLQTIGKLCYTAGLHGRCVVVMSATMSPAVREGLFDAWHKGLTVHAALKEIPLSFGLVFAADTVAPEVMASPDKQTTDRAWDRFAGSVCAHYAKSASLGRRRILRVHDLTASSKAEAFHEIADQAQSLHASHHTVDEKTGIRVSVGYVRLNTAGNAWQLAESLAARPRNGVNGANGGVMKDALPEIRYVSYHSKYPRNYLGVLDAVLGQMTHRKDAASFLATPALRHALDHCESADLVVIVCTTTLIETGRDFDFDWAILEPRSVRGEAQAVGRVRRHRMEALPEGSAANVVLLSRPLKSIEPWAKALWGRPGVEEGSLRVSRELPPLIRDFGMPRVMKHEASYVQPLIGGNNNDNDNDNDVPAASASTASFAPLSTAHVHRQPELPKRINRKTGSASASAPLQSIALATEALPVTQWMTAIDAQLCLQTGHNYSENRIGFIEQALQRMHLSREGKWNKTMEAPPSLAWYLQSYGPLNATHALETPFRGKRQFSALFIPKDTTVYYFDPVLGETLPCMLAKFIDVGVIGDRNALIPDIAAQASLLATDNRHIVGASLRCDMGQALQKLLTWCPLLGFKE